MSAAPSPRSADGLSHRLIYRPGLDGLRAFAVLAVVLFHAGWSRAHGGFLGVDVFFTLSGYLITTLLLSEFHESKTIRLSQFWIRRARRLMPAQSVMAVVVVTIAWLTTPPGYFGRLASDALSAIFYIGNWHLIGQSASYFATGAPPSLFTHAWSLAIEEQFYLVWPLVALFVLRRNATRRPLGYIAIGGALTSFVLTQILFGAASSNRLYYGTDTHAIGIFAGAALAVWLWERAMPRVHDSPWQAPSSITNLAGYTGAFVLATTMLLARGSSDWVFRWGFLVVAVATCMVITPLVSAQTNSLQRFLSWSPLVYLGRLSYGIYLWHYPIIALVTHRTTGLANGSLFGVRLLLTLVLAATSYHVVERPLRQLAMPRRTTWRVLAAGLVIVCAIAVVGSFAQRVPNYPTPPQVAVVDPVRALMLGDSVMLTLDHNTAAWRSRHDVTSSSATVLGCGIGPSFRPIVHGHRIFGNAKCHLQGDGSWPLETIWETTIRSQRPDVVVVGAGRWETHDHLIGHDIHSINDPWFTHQMTRGLTDIWRSSHAVGAHLVVLTTSCVNSGETASGHPWPEDASQRQLAYNDFIKRFASRHNDASVLDIATWVCRNGRFSLFDPSGRYMIRNADGVHFGPGAGPLFGDRFWSAVRRAGEASPAWAQRHH